MPRTLSTAESRARQPDDGRGVPLLGREVVLSAAAAALLLAGLALVLSAGAPAMHEASARLAAGDLVNLRAVSDPDALAPFLRVFPDRRERRFVAREIVSQLSGGTAGPVSRRDLPAVRALARLTVEASRVAKTPGLETLGDRLADLERRAAGGRVSRVPLLTAAQVAALRPSMVVRTPADHRAALGWSAALLIAAFSVVVAVRRVKRRSGDPVIVPVVFALAALGLLLMATVADPLRDRLLFVTFAQGVALGCLVLLACSFVNLDRSPLPRLSFVPLLLALSLSALLVAFGSGPAGSDARVNLFGAQPVDAIRLLVTLFLAGYFAQRWEFLRELEEPAARRLPWLRGWRTPRLGDVLPVVVGIATVLLAFFLQRDLGPALILACLFLVMYGVARGRWLIPAGGGLLLVSGFAVGYLLGVPATVAARVEMWRSPWDNAVRGGDQVAQALWAFASGGLTGTGLGLGLSDGLPAVHTDLVLAAAGEQLGLVGLLAIAVLDGVLVWRGLRAARRAGGAYTCFVAVGLTVGLAAHVLLIAGGLFGLVPLSGVVTPFLSYGRSALVTNFAAMGLLLSISSHGGSRAEATPVGREIRHVGWAIAVLGAAVLTAAVRTHVWARPEIATAAALTRQADGQRRYTYNPRLIAAASLIVRGTIVDRHGTPLAVSRPEVLSASRETLARMGIELGEACPDTGRRCYPFGGPAFHLLGDVETQINWAAPNTSFAERDHDTRLRGYDDEARLVEVADPRGGPPSRTLHRNLRALLPLWEHRANLDHPDARRLLAAGRDVRLTVDARLQWQIASLVRERVEGARLQRAAAVVVDAASGDLLAAVSYPWPAPVRGRMIRGASPGEDESGASLLDRARYGVYPPGSTFKLVTAIEVLRRAPDLADRPLTCRRLDDGRIGNVIPGWRRPIRDDVGDKVPHGQVTLDRGLIHSCNAYFAQLGVRLGASALREGAALFDIATERRTGPPRLRETLPFAAYGQGDVLATPFRMARVAGTIAADGLLAPARFVIDDDDRRAEPSRRVLDVEGARRLANAMRQVVVAGTGRGLLAHPELVAGKTGTAEIEGAPSHSWFVGFAPHGARASRRLAFAVIVEHGGYGGRIAARLAGDIVTAARDLKVLEPDGPARPSRPGVSP
jgi:cell division protein FtsW (lipid II flippase)